MKNDNQQDLYKMLLTLPGWDSDEPVTEKPKTKRPQRKAKGLLAKAKAKLIRGRKR